MVKAKVYIFNKQFDGFPKEGDLKLNEEELPELKDGEFLVEAVFLSVDPYMRSYAARLPLGIPFIGTQVALVKESKNAKYPVGKYVVGSFGWRTYTISDGKPDGLGGPAPLVLPDFGDLPLSLAVGALGMPGNCAYFGFLELCQPKSGETVVVSGAAGAIGSHVGQIAKIKGCTVIGIAGSDEKGKLLMEDLKFDYFINYKTDDIDKALKQKAPQGVDCYFDNVGGTVSSAVLKHMNNCGRISVCGYISLYNEKNVPPVTVLEPTLLVGRQLKIEGFMVYRWLDRWMEGIEQNMKWIKEGKLKYKETITEGFENMFEAFTSMLKGGNLGKAVVKVKQ